MIQFTALFSKELKEAFRDKRALTVALMMGFLAPLMIVLSSTMAIKEHVEKPRIYMIVTGGEYAPQLMQALASENLLTIEQAEPDEQAAWEKRNIQLNIPADYGQKMADGFTIDLTLRADMSEQANVSAVRRIQDAISEHASAIGMKRLLVRGLDIKLLQPINLEQQDTSLPNNNAMTVNLLLSFYLMFTAFIAGLSVAIDTSAGERERNVLELLLCQPVRTSEVVISKLLAASIISMIAIILTISLTAFSLSFVDLSKLGASFSLDFSAVIALLLLFLPICLLASAIQLFLAFKAKTFKEAQSSVSMIIALPGFVPFALMFIDNKPDWVYWMPISGQNMLVESILKGLPVDWGMLAFIGFITLVMGAAFVALTAMRLQSEKTVLALG